jgi:hypothetical protein
LIVTADGTIARRALQTGIVTTTDIEVVSGMDGTEDVISANANAFKEGQKVALIAK